MEFKIEYVFSVLEDTDPVKAIAKSNDNWLSFAHYNANDPQGAAEAIINDEKNFHKHLHGLIKLFPFSEQILLQVLKTKRCASVTEMTKEYSDWIDHSGELEMLISRIYSMITEHSSSGEMSSLQENIRDLEEQKKAKEEEYTELKAFKQKHYQLIKDIEDIDRKIQEEDIPGTEAELEKKRAEKQQKLDAAKKAKRAYVAEIKKLANELTQNSPEDNSECSKAIEAMQRAVAKIPEGEGDI